MIGRSHHHVCSIQLQLTVWWLPSWLLKTSTTQQSESQWQSTQAQITDLSTGWEVIRPQTFFFPPSRLLQQSHWLGAKLLQVFTGQIGYYVTWLFWLDWHAMEGDIHTIMQNIQQLCKYTAQRHRSTCTNTLILSFTRFNWLRPIVARVNSEEDIAVLGLFPLHRGLRSSITEALDSAAHFQRWVCFHLRTLACPGTKPKTCY